MHVYMCNLRFRGKEGREDKFHYQSIYKIRTRYEMMTMMTQND